jgi:hypothetical protein
MKFVMNGMKKWIIPLVASTLLLLQGCGVSVRVISDVDESGDFGSYTTYSFLDFTEGNKKTIPEMELERIRVAFARELESRGLHFVETGGDVSVKIVLYHRQAVDGYYWHSWRYNYMERAISVDMYDNATRKHVWHCAAVGELDYNPQERAENLPAVVAKIFKRYPVQVGDTT